MNILFELHNSDFDIVDDHQLRLKMDGPVCIMFHSDRIKNDLWEYASKLCSPPGVRFRTMSCGDKTTKDLLRKDPTLGQKFLETFPNDQPPTIFWCDLSPVIMFWDGVVKCGIKATFCYEDYGGGERGCSETIKERIKNSVIEKRDQYIAHKTTFSNELCMAHFWVENRQLKLILEGKNVVFFFWKDEQLNDCLSIQHELSYGETVNGYEFLFIHVNNDLFQMAKKCDFKLDCLPSITFYEDGIPTKQYIHHYKTARQLKELC